MRIIHKGHYKFILDSLFGYNKLNLTLPTNRAIKQAIDNAAAFFMAVNKSTGEVQGEMHKTMLDEYYINNEQYRKTRTNPGHFSFVCSDILGIEEIYGYVIRKEIIYRVAMEMFALGAMDINSTSDELTSVQK